MGVISLGDIRVSPSENFAVLTPGNIRITVNTASPGIVSHENPMFFELLVKNLELDALQLAQSINRSLKQGDSLDSTHDDSESPTIRSQKLETEEKLIRQKCSALVAEMQRMEISQATESALDPMATEGLRQLARRAVASAQGANSQTRRNLYEILQKLRNCNEPSPPSSIDTRVASILSILNLCVDGIRGIKLGGTLSRDIGMRIYTKIACPASF